MADYPASLWTGNTRGTNLSDAETHTTWHDEAMAELIAVQTELGTAPRGSSASVKARLDAINALLTSGTWTPTLTNVVVGTGGSAGLSAAYRYANGCLNVRIAITLGTTGASVSGVPAISLPPTFTQVNDVTTTFLGLGVSLLNGGTLVHGLACFSSTSAISIYAMGASGTYVQRVGISATVPGVWAAGDSIIVRGVLYGTFP